MARRNGRVNVQIERAIEADAPATYVARITFFESAGRRIVSGEPVGPSCAAVVEKYGRDWVDTQVRLKRIARAVHVNKNEGSGG